MSVDDIAEALNHVDNGHFTTDIYLAKDWSIVDDVQYKVTQLIKQEQPVPFHQEYAELPRRGMYVVAS